MGTPLRQSILSDIYTTLSGISVSGGYKTDVTTVEKVIRDFDDVSSDLRPWIGFVALTQRYQYQPFGYMMAIMQIKIGAHISATTKAGALEDLDNLRDDIIAILNVDPTRGGYAVSTTILDDFDDSGDPYTVDTNGVGGTLEMNIEVKYQRTTGAS